MISVVLFENSFAQKEMTPHQQWKKFTDLDMLACKSGYVLLQKYSGVPVCVSPDTYLKLIDREFGFHSQSMLDRRPEMMNHLIQSMITNDVLMYHWHQMMQKTPNLMTQTTDILIIQIKANPELLKNLLGPMMSDSQLREKMIQSMKSHDHMENHLKMNPQWMISVHQSIDTTHQNNCLWCPTYQKSIDLSSLTISNSNKTVNLVHDVWVNSKMNHNMHLLVLEDPSHMYLMSQQMMEPILNSIMDDVVLRQLMIELMLEHHEFMNTIRHNNAQNTH